MVPFVLFPLPVPLLASTSPAPLRGAILAVSVLHDIDLTVTSDGVRLDGRPPVRLGWPDLAEAARGVAPQSAAGVRRLVDYLRARQLLVAGTAADRVGPGSAGAPRPYAVTVGSSMHPGPGWAQAAVRGGILELGLGLSGLRSACPGVVFPLPEAAGRHAGVDLTAAQADAGRYLDAMASLAVARFDRRPADPLRPMGDCDVLTLLASAPYRAGLVAGSATGGLRAVAVPMRDRGWADLRHTDREFLICAAAVTPPERRGCDRALLVTREEVTVTPWRPRSPAPSPARLPPR